MSFVNKPGNVPTDADENVETSSDVKFVSLGDNLESADDKIAVRNLQRKHLARGIFKNTVEFFRHWQGYSMGGELAKFDVSIRGEEMSVFMVFKDNTTSTFIFNAKTGWDEPTYIHHSGAAEFDESLRWWAARINERNG